MCPYADYPPRKQTAVKTTTPVNAKRKLRTLSQAQKLEHMNSLIPSSTIEDSVDSVTVDNDPLLSFGKVEPIGEQWLDDKGKSGEPTFLTKSHQKLSVRRQPVNHENVTHKVYATQSVNSRSQDTHDSLPNMFVNRQTVEGGADAKAVSVVEDPDLMNVSELLPSTQAEWDSLDSCGHGDQAPGNMDLMDQLDGRGIGTTAEMEYEPQTYFSFNELLASDDQPEDQYPMSTDNSEWPSIDFETTDQGSYDIGSSDEFVVSSEPCHLCKLNEPSPDLACEVCKIQIHSHCSPWEDDEGARWRCGNCRDWR